MLCSVILIVISNNNKIFILLGIICYVLISKVI